MLNLRSLLSIVLIAAGTAKADPSLFIGEGVRQNTVPFATFDSYSLSHYADSYTRVLSPEVERVLHLTMIAEWGTFFTKSRMVEALEQGLRANSSQDEFSGLSSEVSRFKKTLLNLPINAGSELQFHHFPGTGLVISMKGPNGFAPVFKSKDQAFSMKILSIWLGQAHPDANNRESLVNLIENLWANAQ